MAESSSVVDINVDPLTERRRRQRAFRRIGLPIGGVVLMIVVIVGIAFYFDRANRRDVLALSDDLLAALDSRIALEVSAYLDPATRVIRIGRDMLQDGAIGDRETLAINYASIVLHIVPQIENLLFADEDGNYLMVSHGPADGIDVKLIRNTPGPRRVTWFHRDASGNLIGQEDDPADEFDPRTRPWYAGAVNTDDLFWTGAYLFFTDKKPGVTASIRYSGADGRRYIVGADIALDVLSKFLAALEIGHSGKAFIIDSAGRMVASPSGSVMVNLDGSEPVAEKIDAFGDPIVTRAYDEYRVEGQGRHVVAVDGQRYITAVTPLTSAGRDWSVLMIVPEDDFVGFVARHSRSALALSLLIVTIAVLLAVLLVRQGLRADHNARLLRERQHALDRQSAAFATLAADASLFDPGRSEPPRQLTETLADITGARRASVWRLVDGGRRLHCDDSFDRTTNGHVDGLELHRDELPQFFAHLLQGEEIQVADAARDRRTAELHRVLMQPLGSRALLAIPAQSGTAIVGTVWLEDAAQMAVARDFVRAVANMVAPRMVQAPDISARREAVGALLANDRPPSAVHHYANELRARAIDPESIKAEFYSDIAVMVLRFTDPLAMATRAAEGGRCVSDEIVRALQEVAGKNDIPYLKILGQEAIVAAGFATADAAAASLVADTAMAVRERCIALFEDIDHPQEFRIGIDCGAAIGCTLGAGPQVFNLWGEAVRIADEMAASALPGTVQATEAAYDRLRQDFLFRPRGRFYLPRVGESRTYVLASRL
jgi:adenylate cyclase